MIKKYYVNQEYGEYLNRHINGLIQIGEKVTSIFVDFKNVERFGKGLLRLYIKVQILDFDDLTADEKKITNKYFFNSSDLSGVKYFSFTYKPANSGIDLEKIRQFIYTYVFTVQTLKNIKQLKTNNSCTFNYQDLFEDSFFQLIEHFLDDTAAELYNRNFEEKYVGLYNRPFEFDKVSYNMICEKSKEYEGYKFGNVIREEKLLNIPVEISELLRIFLTKSDTPFKFSFRNRVMIEKKIFEEQLALNTDRSFIKLKQHFNIGE